MTGESKAIATRSARICALAAGLVLLTVVVLSHIAWPRFVLEYEPLHSAIEVMGAVSAVFAALVLLRTHSGEEDEHEFWVAVGLLGMGILDLFHGVARPGHGFVLLHCMAGLAGGAGFACLLLPRISVPRSLRKRIPLYTIGGAVLLGFWAIFLRETLPAARVNGKFTPFAVGVNLTAAALFILSAARLWLDYRRLGRRNDYIFFCMACLFGLAALAFPFSALWEDSWWFWHILRLAACLMVLGLILGQYLQAVSVLRTTIAGLKQAEAAQREEEARYQSLFENMLEGYAHCRMVYEEGQPSDFLYIGVNRAFEALTGLRDVTGKKVTEVIPGIRESNPELFEIYGRVASSGKPERFETLVPSIGVWFSIAVYRPKEGEFVAIFDNITERKWAEGALRETNAYLDNLLNYANAPIIVWDPQFKITRFNRAFEALTGRKAEAVVGESLEILFPPTQVTSSMGQIRKTQTGERWETVEIDIIHIDGSVRTILWNSATLFAPDNKTPVATIAQGQDITERKHAEEQLRDSEARLRLLIEGVKDYAIYLLAPDGSIVSWNAGAERQNGYRSEEIVGKHFSMLFTPEDQQSRKPQRILASAESMGRSEDESWRVREDGSRYWTDSIITALRREDGSLYGFAKITRDLTERKKAEEALRETNEYLDNLLNYANAPIIVWDPQFRITRFNHAFEELTGRKAEAVVGESIEILFPPAQVCASMEFIRKTLTGERWETVEIDILNLDGSVRTVLWNSATLFAPDNKTPVATIAQGQDITERKQAEEKRSASEIRYRRLFEAARDGILILDAETGMIVDVNPFLIEMLGYSREEFLGKKVWELGFLRDIAANHENLDELRRKEYIRYEHMPFETADGGRIEVEFVSIVYLVNNRKVVQCNIRDITDRRRVEVELALHREHLEEIVSERTKALEESNREMEAFSYSVSHDLRAPLRAVSGYAHLLLDESGPRLDDEGRRMLTVVKESASRMGKLIDDLLAFSRVGRAELEHSQIQMEPIVWSVWAELHPAGSEGGGDLVLSPLPSGFGDGALLKQVWANLLGNALKFSAGVPEPRVVVGGSKEGTESVYWVKDNGAGFDPRFAHKLFGVFHRLHRQDEFPGTGVGLALVERIVSRHGGRVWAEGEVGRGATFWFSLPGPSGDSDGEGG